MTKELALASGYGELMERFQLGYIGRADVQKDGVLSTNDTQTEIVDAKTLLERNRKWYVLMFDRLQRYVGNKYSPEDILMQYADQDGNVLCTPYYCMTTDSKEYLPLSLRKAAYTASGCASGNTVEEAIVHALSENGKLYVREKDREDEIGYDGMECFDWENLVWVDSALYDHGESDTHTYSLTVAGIQADGTVVACGEYADEILSWGPLSYLSMNEGMIAALTTDGTPRLTGQASQSLKAEVESWTDIAGIRAGKVLMSRTDYLVDVVSAIAADGSFRVCFCDMSGAVVSLSFSLDDMGDADFYRYSPDGNVYLPNSETGEWEIWEPEMEE